MWFVQGESIPHLDERLASLRVPLRINSWSGGRISEGCGKLRRPGDFSNGEEEAKPALRFVFLSSSLAIRWHILGMTGKSNCPLLNSLHKYFCPFHFGKGDLLI